MNALWSYFWPAFAAGVVIGTIIGVIAFRPRNRRDRALAIGLGITLACAGLWHGPLGGANRFSARVERTAREALDYYEMTKVTAHLHHGPLTRRLILSGPADDFQTSELVRLFSQLPGVSQAQWTVDPSGPPLILEDLAVGALGFLVGLFLGYLVELHRRYNAQWNW
jgi:hypothetical protein